MKSMASRNVIARALLASLVAMAMVSSGCGAEAEVQERLVGEWALESDPRYPLVFRSDGSGEEGDTPFTWEVVEGDPHPLIRRVDERGSSEVQVVELTDTRMRVRYRGDEVVFVRRGAGRTP